MTATGLPVIVKVPVLVALMTAEYLAIIPPNRAPKREDRSKFGADDLLSISADWQTHVGVAGFWLIHLLEVASIVSLSDSTNQSSSLLFALVEGSRTGTQPHLYISPLFLIGSILLILGAAIRQTCYVYLGRMFTFQLALLKEHKLVTSGPYAVVRHPSYTGFILVVHGLALVHLTPGSYVAECGLLELWWGRALIGLGCAAAVYLQIAVVRRTGREDEVLRKEFGETWDAWAIRTPYRLVPYVY